MSSPLTPLLLLLSTLLTLTTSTTPSNTTTAMSNATHTPPTSQSTPTPFSYSSLAASALPGGNALPALTLSMYADPDCTYINATYNFLTNELPLSYDIAQPAYPFQAFIMTRNLTLDETLTFFATSNTSQEACGVQVGNLTGADGGVAGLCVPILGATCYNLTRG